LNQLIVDRSMATGKSIRIYDLAREVKQDAKRIVEDLRREGADVSVPSNSVSHALAEKIRGKYLAKQEAPVKRAIKVIKAAKKPKPAEEEVSEAAETQPAEAAPADEPVEAVAEPVKKAPARVKALSKKDAEEAPAPAPEPVAEEPKETKPKVKKLQVKPAEEAVPAAVEPAEEAAPEPAAPAPEAPVTEAPKTSVVRKTLTLTKEALEKGIRPGTFVTKTSEQRTGTLTAEARQAEAERRKGGRGGTNGEKESPQMVYKPSADSRRKVQGRRGKPVRGDDRAGKFNDGEIEAPQKRSIEERVLDQIGSVDPNNLKQIRLTEGATVREFAEGIGVTPRDIVQLLMKQGVLASLNQTIAEKTAIDFGRKFGFDITFVPFEELVTEEEFEELIAADADDVELPRAPVITVMGHVDHGKTSLLDAIRQANVAEGEAGGITQHIGAYSVTVPNPDNPEEERRVVFLDTPGHEAFTMMRARGAKATDIVILVVAADDGVMPQTIEAVEHSKAAGVPIIVAINKIDKPDANPDKVKQGLAALGLQPTDWGGDTDMVPVSAKQKKNLDTLLETVLLQADLLELRASPTRRATGVVLEAKLDKGRGAVATVLVQQGTLKIGDPFIVGQYSGKVRAMISDRGEHVLEAPPATPVEVLGLQGVPQAGDNLQVVSDVDRAQQIAQQRQMHARQAALLKTTKRGIESLGQAEIKELLVVLKADVQGSVEVLRATLEKLSTDKVKVRVIRAGVGAIAESDVLLASATQADDASTAVVIIGFNVRPESRAADIAKQEEVDIRLHSVIYKVEEEIKAAMIGMLDAIEKEVVLGKAVVQETFKVSRIGTIAGCRVTDGVVRRQAKARLIRDGVVIWEGDIATLKRFKDDTNEVAKGYECGISLVNFNDIKVDDEIEAFVIEKIAATEL
jgi:translation initiation factor IF-2